MVASKGATRVLDVAFTDEGEARLPADRVRGPVRDPRERVDYVPAALGPGPVEERPDGLGGQSSSLEGGEHHPADLVDGLTFRVMAPDAYSAGRDRRPAVGDDGAVPDPAGLDVLHDPLELV